MKKALKIFAITFGIFFLLLLLLPLLFKGQITEMVRNELNKQVEATIEFEDVGISLIRNFPNLNFRLHGLTITGEGEFEDIVLLSSDYIGFTFNLSSLWKKDSPYELRRLDINKPYIHLITLGDGRSNYNIFPSGEESGVEEEVGETEGINFALRAYSIVDGHFKYDDRAANTRAELKGFNHSGSGDFTESVFDWRSTTSIRELSVFQNGIQYLNSVPLDWTIELGVDLNQSTATIARNELKLSELHLDLDGSVSFSENENLFLDLRMDAPGNEFKELFSVLPIAAMADMDRLSADGSFSLRAMANGPLDIENEVYPSFEFAALVSDGIVRYPDMDLPLEAINLDLLVKSPESELDLMTVNLSRFSVTIAGNPVEGDFFLSRPISDPAIKTRLDGQINLGDIAKIFPMEGLEKLAGRISANLNADFLMSQVDNEAWDEMELEGNFLLSGIEAIMSGMPSVGIPSGNFSFDRRTTTMENVVLNIADSDLKLSGAFNNLLVLYTGKNAFKGNLTISSDLLDLDNLMAAFEGTEEVSESGFEDSAEVPNFFNIDIDLAVSANKIVYRPYEIRDLNGQVKLLPHLISSSDISLILNDSDLRGRVSIENWYEFAMADERMTVDADLRAGTLDLDKLMVTADDSEDDSDSVTEAGPPSVPSFKYNIHVNARADRVIYRPFELNEVRTKGYLTERDVHIEDFSCVLFGDRLQGSGFIGNYMNFVFLDETLTGELDLRSTGLNLNNWMTAMMAEETNVPPDQVSTDEFEPILIPKNIDMAIRANMGNLSYFDMNFSNASGALEIKDGALEIQDFNGRLFNGVLRFSGIYDTGEETPFTSMKLDIERLDIPKSFANIASLAAVAPLFEYVNGLFTSSLVMATDLGPGMMPVWSTFNAEGFVETIDAQVRNFPPLQRAAERLRVDLFERLDLNNTQAWFEVINGTFDLKPVTHIIRDTEMEFKGQHSIGGSMNYMINASVPQAILGSGTVGATVTSGIDFIRSEAGRRGVNLAEGSHVDVAINLKGTLRNPEVSVNLLGVSTSGEVRERTETVIRDRLDQEKEEARERVEQEIEERREQLDQAAQQVQDSLRRLAEEKERELAERARREAEQRLRGLFGSDTTKTDTVKPDSPEDIKQRIRNFNPFRRGGDDDG